MFPIGRQLTRASVALVCLLGACGGGGGSGNPVAPPGNTTPPPSPPTGSSAASSASISMNSDVDSYGYGTNSFQPPEVTVKKGGTVTWNNSTGVTHNVTFAPVAGAPANVSDNSNGTNARVFEAVGVYTFQCTNHSGMTGKVTVVE